jgi:branched-chain amino acid aminotransferase
VRAWINGRLLDDPTAPAVGVADHGLTVGDGAFEAVKVVDGRPFALTRHLDRLLVSAKGLGLPEPDLDAVRDGVDAVLHDPPIARGKLRITVTGGPAPLGSGRGHGDPTVVVAVEGLDPAAADVAVVTVPWPRNERGALAGLKTTSYAENVMALQRAHEQGAAEAVFANLAGNLCEGTGTNVFYVVEGQLRTPTLGSGCLAGVTRALVLEWYDDVTEIDESIGVLDRADEIFLTSTTRDVQPVSRWNTRELSTPGPVTRAVQEAWRRRQVAGLDP